MHSEDYQKIAKLINEQVDGAEAKTQEVEAGDQSVEIAVGKVLEVCQYLKNNDDYSFNSLQVISGVDYGHYLEVNYFLNNIDIVVPRQLQVKVKIVDRVSPKLNSVSSIWKAADWQERECYDMLGVEFIGHPDPRRILCPDDWEGFPLRKDYMAPKMYNGMEVFPEDKMNIADREFKIRQKLIQKQAQAKAEDQ